MERGEEVSLNTISCSQVHPAPQQAPPITTSISRELPIIEPLFAEELYSNFDDTLRPSYIARFKELSSDRGSTGGSSTGDLLWENEIVGSQDELVSDDHFSLFYLTARCTFV